jgi:hypothetical protein
MEGGVVSNRSSRLPWSCVCLLTLLAGASCTASLTSPAPSLRASSSPATPAPSLPGTPGHFDDGQFSFDYPVDWPLVQVGDPTPYADTTRHIYAVLGMGTWDSGCSGGEGMPSLHPGEWVASPVVGWMSCTGETFRVAPGGVLVEVYRWYGGPLPGCDGDRQANATFGDLAVRQTDNPTYTSWEIRDPGNEFGKPNNVFIEVHTLDPGHLAQAKAIVASFRWAAGIESNSSCFPTPLPSPTPS